MIGEPKESMRVEVASWTEICRRHLFPNSSKRLLPTSASQLDSTQYILAKPTTVSSIVEQHLHIQYTYRHILSNHSTITFFVWEIRHSLCQPLRKPSISFNGGVSKPSNRTAISLATLSKNKKYLKRSKRSESQQARLLSTVLAKRTKLMPTSTSSRG